MPHQTLAEHPASSSSSQPVTPIEDWPVITPIQDWRDRLRLHFPGFTIIETNSRGYVINYYMFLHEVLINMSSVQARKILAKTLMGPRYEEWNFSFVEFKGKPIIKEKIKVLFEGIEMHLNNHSSNYQLETLIHYRLPSPIANQLYNYALQGFNTIPILYWALICKQPITREMLIGITTEQLDRATRFAANIHAIGALYQLKKLIKELDLTSAYLVAIHRNFYYLVEKLLELSDDTESLLDHSNVKLENSKEKEFSVKDLSAEKILMLFKQIETYLRNYSDLRFDILIDYRLPSPIANQLYNHALQGSSTIPMLYWAFICEQPITSEMLSGITTKELDLATKFAADINAISALYQLKELNKELDLTSACLVAIDRKLHDLLEKLLKLGVDTESAKSPLLHAAVRVGDIAMASLLLQHHANINAVVGEATPLHLAVVNGDITMIKLLLIYGANINFPAGADGMTALHFAYTYHFTEALGELLSAGMSARVLSGVFDQSPFDPKIEAVKNEEWNRTCFFQPAPVVSSEMPVFSSEKPESTLPQQLLG